MKIVEPKVRGFLCTTAHPEGCKAHVQHQINRVLSQPLLKMANLNVANLNVSEPQIPKRVLIIGGSAGYGLASRIVCAAGYGAQTVSVSLEKPPKAQRTGSAGWYNNYYLEQWINDHASQHLADNQRAEAYSINGDAFSEETKQQTLAMIKQTLGQVDLVVYSLAAPRRIKTESATGNSATYQSVIKPIGERFEGRSIDTASGEIKEVALEPATPQEIDHTIEVMGGEDWFDWIRALHDHELIADSFQTVAFSYLGGDLTKAIYGDGTLGAAKQDVEHYCQEINRLLGADAKHAKAKVAVLKAIVTQSSAAIPSLPLYISTLYQVMKSAGNHEDCLDQILRLFTTGLYNSSGVCQSDGPYRLRLDEEELKPYVQDQVKALWQQVSQQNLYEITDFQSYRSDFMKLFGFEWPEVDYHNPVSCIPER